MSLEVVSASPENLEWFRIINEEWITDMFAMEEKDRRVLTHPEEEILVHGGKILFVRAKDLGIVGTGALLKTSEGEYELTKMGVLKKARNLKAGDFLLKALIAKATELKAENLYLLTNQKCEAAIHLYLKNGFVHDKEIMERFGAQYQRCDVAMRWIKPK